jgi:hypothetical protein
MIPKQLAAVSKELVYSVGLIRSNKEYAIPVVGQARVSKVARKPDPQIPDLFEFVDNSLKSGSFVCTEEARHIFKHNPFRRSSSRKFRKVEEKSASLSFEPFSLCVGVADVLARPTGRP